MLSYDWIKIIITIVVVIFLWIILLNTVAAQPAVYQKMFIIYNNDISLGENYMQHEEKLYDDGDYDGVFSYEVYEAGHLEMSSSEYGNTLFSARLATGERNMIFTSTQINEEDENKRTYLEALINGNTPIFQKIPEYLENAKEYISKYYNGDLNGSLNKSAVEKDFRERVAATKDKRFKKEEQILSGLKDEYERIELLKKSYLGVINALDEGILTLTNTYVEATGTSECYSICVGTSRMQKLKELSYVITGDNVKTASGINVCIFTPVSEEAEYMQYENLVYLNYLVTTYADKL